MTWLDAISLIFSMSKLTSESASMISFINAMIYLLTLFYLLINLIICLYATSKSVIVIIILFSHSESAIISMIVWKINRKIDI